MEIRELSIQGSFEIRPQVHVDERGAFLESFRADRFRQAIGHGFSLSQANCSVSTAGTLRGVHFAQLPPSQAKYITCMRGTMVDVVVDIRVGSPTFGQWEMVELDDHKHNAVYLSEGLGHAFMALEDQTVASYLCSAPYAAGREFGINPFDPELAIDWPRQDPAGQLLTHVLSPKDQAAPGLTEARQSGLLPGYDEAMSFVAELD